MTRRSALTSFHLVIIFGLLISACVPGLPQPPANTTMPMPTVATLSTKPAVEVSPEPTATPSPKPTERPLVVSHLPPVSTITDLNPEIAFIFNQPMDIESLVQAFEMKPDVGYSLRWTEDRLEVLLDKPLTPSGSYQFTIDRNAHSVGGQSLRNNFIWTLHIAPVISKVIKPTAERPEPKIEFKFNYALNRTSF
jgi:hypothetical protein